jgi:aerobic-type carbon monoxide dehydrogenase small subunit (CoxS/CutS family)
MCVASPLNSAILPQSCSDRMKITATRPAQSGKAREVMMAKPIELEINGKRYAVQCDPETPLLSALRDELGLTGTKYGCGEGQCGACTVLIAGAPRRSCQIPVSAAGGKSITTIEGLEQNGHLHPVQQAFLEAGAFQCAYCTSGMIMSSVGFLKANPRPTSAEIVQFLQGNICRCGTYPRIIEAVRQAAMTILELGQG